MATKEVRILKKKSDQQTIKESGLFRTSLNEVEI
jgi:hypothetical protein